MREVAVALHGFGREGLWTSVLLGGRNRDLARHVHAHLAPRLPDYEVVDDLDRIPTALRGLHPDNPVNRARGAGVQVELPPRIRGMGPHWEGRDRSMVPPMAALIDGLADAARHAG